MWQNGLLRLEDFHTRAIIFADEGREQGITAALRRMSVINHIPSKFGDWGGGRYTKTSAPDILSKTQYLRKASGPILCNLPTA